VQLQRLDFSRNALGSAAATELLEALFRCQLRTLLLSNCDLDVLCTRGVAFLLDNSLTLETLDLSWNRLGPEGCRVRWRLHG
jgi:Ran GTPase-activating protein (RanGAP) involved in mRNA processing and transport